MKKLTKNKKGITNAIEIFRIMMMGGVVFAVALLILAFTVQIQGETQDDIGVNACPTIAGQGTYSYNKTDNKCYNGSAGILAPTGADFNATVDAIAGVGKLTNKAPTMGTVFGAGIIISLLIGVLGFLGFRAANK